MSSNGNRYYPYGQAYSGTSQGETPTFATYVPDQGSGMLYADQRYYDAAWGRFVSPDPSDKNIDPTVSRSWNRFAYVNGDPQNANDPYGEGAPCTGYAPDGEGVTSAITCIPTSGDPNNTVTVTDTAIPIALVPILNCGPGGVLGPVYGPNGATGSGSSAPSNGSNISDQWTFNGNLFPGTHPQDGVFTTGPLSGPMNSNPLVLACCQAHDNCYAQHQSNASSWVPVNIGSCTVCNITVVACIKWAVLPVMPPIPY